MPTHPSADDAIQAVARAVAQALAAGLEIHLDATPPEPAPAVLPGGGDPLAGLRLTRLERGIVEVLLEHGGRLTTYPLIERLQAHLGEPVSEGRLKPLLARMTAPEVGILSSHRHGKHAGYSLTRDFRAELAMRRQAVSRRAE